jgi:hypothetical protein
VSKDSLRRPFGRALQYFQIVVRRSEDLTSNAVRVYGISSAETNSTPNVGTEESPEPSPSLSRPSGGLSTARVQELAQSRQATSYFGGENDRMPSENDNGASPFLQDRCLLCFGEKQQGSLGKG